LLNNFNFLAGIALMLLGIRCLRRGSERFFGTRLRQLLHAATQNRWRALLAGIVISILTPSSTAVALLTVEAISGGFMSFQQVLALMLGANIGFTLTVQLLAFKFFIYNALFLVAGIPVYVFSKRIQWRGAGQALMGVGFLLLAIQLISSAVAPLKNEPDVVRIIEVLGNHPIWLMLFAVLLKIILQSATATIGVAIAMCTQGVLPVSAAVIVVIGANIGIGVTALIAGFARTDTRRMALGNLLFKLVGAAVCLPFLPLLLRWLAPLSLVGATHDSQLIANAHTLFNLALAGLFLPVLPWIAGGLARLIPERVTDKAESEPRYLDSASLESPALALGQATRESLHMADHVRAMLCDTRQALATGDEALCAAVQKHDDIVDLLNNAIKTYITKLSEQSLTGDESCRQVALLTFANDLETIGDIIDKNLIDLVRKKIKLNVEFSPLGRAQLDGFFAEVLANFEIAVAAFASQDRVLAEQLLQLKRHVDAEEVELRNQHFDRLRAGLAVSFETSAVHLDLLTFLKHINSHLTAVAHPILEAKAV
jgi:phosphate:Na+ symporter